MNTFPSLVRVTLLLVMSIILAGFVSLLIDTFPHKSAIVLSELVLILPTVYFLRRDGYPLRRVYRLNPVEPAVLIYAGLAGLGLTVLTDELDRLIQPMIRRFIPMPEGFERMMEELLRAQTVYEWVSILVGAVLLAGIIEEMMFRGLLQGAVEERVNGVIAVAVAAVVFGLFHLNPWWFIQIVVLGALFGVAVWRCDSILPGAVMHAVNNLVSIVFINLPENSLTWYADGDQVRPAILIAAAALAAYAGWEFWTRTEKGRAEVERTTVSQLGD
jgi:membrane protease YdiL (CAAX protease family)